MKKIIVTFFIGITVINAFAAISTQAEKKIVQTSKKKKPWHKRRMDAFAGFPSLQQFSEDNFEPKRPSDIAWYFPYNTPSQKTFGAKEAFGAHFGNLMAFNLMRIANMALTAAASLVGMSYHAVKSIQHKSGLLYFSKLILYDALIALIAQKVAFNLENFIEYSHQKLIRKYPFFRSKRGDLVFKSIATLIKLGFPFLAWYAHYSLAQQSLSEKTAV